MEYLNTLNHSIKRDMIAIQIRFFKIYGYIFVRPRRYLFGNMGWNSDLRPLPVKHEYFGWRLPNWHWWILYKTVFRFFKWLYWDGCIRVSRWEKRWFKGRTNLYGIIRRIGATTAGCAIMGGECYHCAFPGGSPVELSDPDGEYGEEYFELTDSGTSSTPEGVDHWFRGITTCPRCGYKQEYGDGSL